MTFDDIACAIGYITIAFWAVTVVLWIMLLATGCASGVKNDAFIVIEKFLGPERTTIRDR